MMQRWLTICMLAGMALVTLHAEPEDAMLKKASRRYSSVGIHNLAVGLTASGWSNVHVGVDAWYEIGSNRNIVNGWLGAGYHMLVPVAQASADMLGHYVPVTVGLKCNYYAWNLNSAYVAVDGSYHFSVGSPLYQSYTALTGRLGVHLKTLDISVHYTYDLAPQFNQKYVYENPQYDYQRLHATIYERMQLGIRIAYYFTLGL